MKKQPISFGIVGAGRVVENFYIPVFQNRTDIRLDYIVDTNRVRGNEIAIKYGIPKVSQDVGDVLGKVDAAIVATPHHKHAEIARHLLDNSISVLVEKPMAMTFPDCEMMIDSSIQNSTLLAVGQIERFYDVNQWIKETLQNQMFGMVTGYRYLQGCQFRWDVVSDFQFRRDQGGGILSDIGCHILDKVLWWFGECEIESYTDDAWGGVESDCTAILKHSNGVRGEIQISRIRDLANNITFYSENGSAEVSVGTNPKIVLRVKDSTDPLELTPPRVVNRTGGITAYFDAMLSDFVESLSTGRPPRVSGEEGAKAVRLIERLRAVRKPTVFPWEV